MKSIAIGALVLAGCAPGQGVVLVSVEGGPVAGVAALHISVENAGTQGAPTDLMLPHPVTIPPPLTFSISFGPDRKGEVTVTVDARDAAGHTLATATGHGSVSPSQESTLTVTFPGGNSDGGMVRDGSASDGSAGDGGTLDGPIPESDLGSCNGQQDGTPCGQVTYGSYTMCSYGATCDNSGSRTRAVMTPTCMAGTCNVVGTMETDTMGCARNTDGNSCGSNLKCSGGNCSCAPGACGDNNCGSCAGNETCVNGFCQCQAMACDNVYCGPDGCGGSCDCDHANGQNCIDINNPSQCCYVGGHYCTNGDVCCNGACNLGNSTCP
jgi:hypothetical protein